MGSDHEGAADRSTAVAQCESYGGPPHERALDVCEEGGDAEARLLAHSIRGELRKLHGFARQEKCLRDSLVSGPFGPKIEAITQPKSGQNDPAQNDHKIRRRTSGCRQRGPASVAGLRTHDQRQSLHLRSRFAPVTDHAFLAWRAFSPACLSLDVRAPSEARRFLSGGSPDVTKPNQVVTTECCVDVS